MQCKHVSALSCTGAIMPGKGESSDTVRGRTGPCPLPTYVEGLHREKDALFNRGDLFTLGAELPGR